MSLARSPKSYAVDVAYALVRAASRLFSTPPRFATVCFRAGVARSGDAARRSAYATFLVENVCEKCGFRWSNPSVPPWYRDPIPGGQIGRAHV